MVFNHFDHRVQVILVVFNGRITRFFVVIPAKRISAGGKLAAAHTFRAKAGRNEVQPVIVAAEHGAHNVVARGKLFGIDVFRLIDHGVDVQRHVIFKNRRQM